MILVTGGDGFIGRQVCSSLSKHNHEVLALDRRFTAHPPHPVVTGDLTDTAWLAELFREYAFDTVIHLASLLGTASRRQPREAMRVNIGGSLGLLESAGQFKAARFIYGSSISVYGSQRFSDVGDVSETTPASPQDVYGVAKRYVEIVGETIQRPTGLQFAALRIATVVGAGARNTSSEWRSAIFEKLTSRQPVTINIPFQRDEVIPLVHVEDVAEMIRCLVETQQLVSTIYNTPAESWKCGELAEYISSLNSCIQFTFGQSRVDGIPQVINGGRFREAFSFDPTPIKQRLVASAKEH